MVEKIRSLQELRRQRMDNEKINEIESLDKYFPKGDKRRGEALILVAEAFLLGKATAQKKKQGMTITTGQLHRIIEDLEEEHTKWEGCAGSFSEEQKFQINIINKTPECSDTWEIEDLKDS